MTVRPEGESRVLLVMGKALANLVSVTLRHGRYETRGATREDACQALLREWKPDLVVIDIDHFMPFIHLVGSGLGHGHIPILAFTRTRDAALKLRAYEDGVDDIIAFPFTLDEIIARPYALIRRSRGVITPLVPKIRLNHHLEVDVQEQTVRLDGSGKSLDLTPLQQTLLYILAANEGEVLTRETLLASIWGTQFPIESNVVDRHIRELRVKLGDDWRIPRYIETISGMGYRFKAPTEKSAEPTLSGA